MSVLRYEKIRILFSCELLVNNTSVQYSINSHSEVIQCMLLDQFFDNPIRIFTDPRIDSWIFYGGAVIWAKRHDAIQSPIVRFTIHWFVHNWCTGLSEACVIRNLSTGAKLLLFINECCFRFIYLWTRCHVADFQFTLQLLLTGNSCRKYTELTSIVVRCSTRATVPRYMESHWATTYLTIRRWKCLKRFYTVALVLMLLF